MRKIVLAYWDPIPASNSSCVHPSSLSTSALVSSYIMINIYIHTHIYIYMYTCTYIYIYEYMYVYMYIYAYPCIYSVYTDTYFAFRYIHH